MHIGFQSLLVLGFLASTQPTEAAIALHKAAIVLHYKDKIEMLKVKKKYLIPLGITSFCLGLNCSAVNAAFIGVPPAPASGLPRPLEQSSITFRHTWTWDFGNGAVNPFIIDGPFWRVELESAAGAAAGTEDLTLRVRHLDPPPHPMPGGPDIPESPPAPAFYTVTLPGLTRPIAGFPPNRTSTKVSFLHPTRDRDDITLTATIRAPGGGLSTVFAEGKHAPEPLTIIASGLAVGLGALCQREYSKKRRKK